MVAVLVDSGSGTQDGGDGYAIISYSSNFACYERDVGTNCDLPYLHAKGALSVGAWAGACKEGDSYYEEYSPAGFARGEWVEVTYATYNCQRAP